MKVAVGADHAAFERKEELIETLREWGHEVIDCGAYSLEAVDYPDVAVCVCEKVMSGQAERGVLICGTGVGMSMSANKIPGIRCSLCSEEYSARLTRQHNDANVLALGARTLGSELSKSILGVWLETLFDASDKTLRRVGKINALDKSKETCKPERSA